MSLVALLGGILNSLHRFAMAAGAPVLLNVVLISALLIAGPWAGATEPATAWRWPGAWRWRVRPVRLLLWVSCGAPACG
jgi:hypothetical protein